MQQYCWDNIVYSCDSYYAFAMPAIMQGIWVGVNLNFISAYMLYYSKWYEIARFCYQRLG